MKLPILESDQLMPLSKNVGKVIKKRREVMQLSQREFARRYRGSRTNLGRVERGEQSVELNTLERMSVVLETTPLALLAETEVLAY
jgi:transcriptional regulator with XRE-family HTH domain